MAGVARTEPQDSLILRRIPYTFRRFSVKDRDLTAPPGAPSEGDRYIVATGGSGAWSGHDLEIAEWHAAGASAAAWIFEDPWRGYRTYVEDEATDYEWSGTDWIQLPSKTYVDDKITGLNWQEPVLDRDLAAPPGSPNEGDRYIVKATGTGDWAGHDNDIAEWNGSSWDFTAEGEGMACYCDDENIFIYFDGTNWAKLASGVGVVTQEKVEKDDTEAQAWTDPLVSLKSNLNRIRHQIVAITGEAWGIVSHSIVDVWAKFHETTGHKHTAAAGDAPKLDAADTHGSSSPDTHHPQSHTLASHSSKTHSELTGVGADDHHNELHDTDKHTNLEYDSASSSGLNFYYKAGRVRNDNVITNVGAGFVALADNDVSYVEVDGSGVVTDNIVGFTAGKIPLYEVTTASGAITVTTDKRTWIAIGGGGGSSTFLGLTDTPANYTGHGKKQVRVKNDESGLEFVDTPAIPISFEMEWREGETYYQHFHIKIGTGTAPTGGSYVVDKESKDNQTDWVYFSPDNLESIPSGGIDYLHDGLRAQYTVAAGTLARGTIYNVWKKVYNVNTGHYGNWNFLGAISL